MSRRWLSSLASELPRLCEDLEELVRIESPSADAVRVSQLASWIQERLRKRAAARTPGTSTCSSPISCLEQP